MREIRFYRTGSGHCPVEEFLDTLSAKQAQKVTWVLKLIEELDMVPRQYFQKMVNTDDLWEVRVQFGGNIFRLLGFFGDSKTLILNHGFTKKTQKTPQQEIALAKNRKHDHLRRTKQ